MEETMRDDKKKDFASAISVAGAADPQSGTRISLRNILFATDFSTVSSAALNHALGIARRYESHLYVAHVIHPDAFQLVPPEAVASVTEHTRRYAEQQMAQLLISGRLRDIPHQVLLEHGDLWTVMSFLIEKHKIDLIVVGTHGRTGVRKLLLGSAAEEIFRLAPCPVLTVGPKVPSEIPAETELRRILYATDFTPHSDRATAYAFSLAQEHQAHLHLMHAVQGAADVSAPAMAKLKEFFRRQLSQLMPEEAELWCEPEILLEFGTPADEILKAAAQHNADLIVMGVRRSATFAGHLPPATAYKVVCQAPCPVLTVRG
jgi:nucleotide-binding universal stress UspA family protein